MASSKIPTNPYQIIFLNMYLFKIHLDQIKKTNLLFFSVDADVQSFVMKRSTNVKVIIL